MANPEKLKAIGAEYYRANKERLRPAMAAYAAAHPESVARRHLKHYNGIADPPQELVELIVTNRRLKRLLKEKQDEQ